MCKFAGADTLTVIDFTMLYVVTRRLLLSSRVQSLVINLLRVNVCNFRELVDSREFLNFFIFCSNNLYSTLISKITLKLVTAFYFFRNQAKFEKL